MSYRHVLILDSGARAAYVVGATKVEVRVASFDPVTRTLTFESDRPGFPALPLYNGDVVELVERQHAVRTADDDEFRRGYREGTRLTYHGRFARCPDCGNATVGLAPPYAISHEVGCAAPTTLPPREERTS